MTRALGWIAAAVAVIVGWLAAVTPSAAFPVRALSSRMPPGPTVSASGSPAPSQGTTPSSSATEPIPGGGRIVFTGFDASGQDVSFSGDVGVVDANGAVRTFYRGFGDPMWDPLHPGGILVIPSSSGGTIPLFRREGGGWARSGGWEVGPDYNARVSPDGRWVAYKVFRGHRETPLLQVASRTGGVRRSFPLPAAVPGSWEPISWARPEQLIVARRGGDLFTWDVGTGAVAPFLGSPELAEALPGDPRIFLIDDWGLSWSAGRRYFAASATWRRGGAQRSGIVVGSVSGTILHVIPTDGSSVIPTWSPARPELAWVESPGGDGPARLYRFDMASGRRTLEARGVPSAWWAAWSPRGDWLLVAPYQGEWVFVSRDGGARVTYPSLGAFPRWASPGADIRMPVC